jgi:hypothetical protein
VPKHMLSARQVQVAREGDIHDGEGLILRVQKTAASWVLRYRVASGKRRELGLGAVDRSSIQAAGASLTGARELADEARNQLKRGIDPIDARRAVRKAEWDAALKERGEAIAAATTLRNYAKAYYERQVEPLRTFKHGRQWINSIEQHVPAALLDATLPGAGRSSRADRLGHLYAPRSPPDARPLEPLPSSPDLGPVRSGSPTRGQGRLRAKWSGLGNDIEAGQKSRRFVALVLARGNLRLSISRIAASAKDDTPKLKAQ